MVQGTYWPLPSCYGPLQLWSSTHMGHILNELGVDIREYKRVKGRNWVRGRDWDMGVASKSNLIRGGSTASHWPDMFNLDPTPFTDRE